MGMVRAKAGRRWVVLAAAGILASLLATAPQANSTVERGRELVEGIAACGTCHQGRDDNGRPSLERGLSGGLTQSTPLGSIRMANITPDVDPDRQPLPDQWGAGGVEYRGAWGVAVSRNLTPDPSRLAGWSDADIERAVRTGIRPDGTRLKPPMPYSSYATIGDRDMRALIAYLRSLPPRPFGGNRDPLATGSP